MLPSAPPFDPTFPRPGRAEGAVHDEHRSRLLDGVDRAPGLVGAGRVAAVPQEDAVHDLELPAPRVDRPAAKQVRPPASPSDEGEVLHDDARMWDSPGSGR